MKHLLVVVDIQKDFVDGALGTAEAVAIVENAAKKIREFDGEIFVTYDTHFENYMDTAEGAKLPVPHCIKGTEGWELNATIAEALAGKKYIPVEKITFGSTELPRLVKETVGDAGRSARAPCDFGGASRPNRACDSFRIVQAYKAAFAENRENPKNKKRR